MTPRAAARSSADHSVFSALPGTALAVSSHRLPRSERASMNNAFPVDDGNFKRGAFKPIAIIVGLLIVAGAVVFFLLSAHGETQTMTKDAVTKEILDIQLLPRAEQTPRWRKWAETESEPRLQQEAFVHLSWAKDKPSIPAMITGLSSVDHTVRGTAAMALAAFGSPD